MSDIGKFIGKKALGFAAGGVSSLIDSGLGLLFGKASAENSANLQLRNSMALMNMQNKINQQNALKSYQFALQAAHLAGVNPNVAVGGSAPSVAGVSSPSVGMPDSQGFVPNSMQNALAGSQMAQVDANSQLLESQKAKIDAEADAIRTQNQYLEDFLKGRNDLMRNNASYVLSKKDLTDWQKEEVIQKIDWLDQTWETRKEQLQEGINYMVAQNNRLGVLNHVDLQKLPLEQKVLNAQAGELLSRNLLNRANSAQAFALVAFTNEQTDGLKMANKVRSATLDSEIEVNKQQFLNDHQDLKIEFERLKNKGEQISKLKDVDNAKYNAELQGYLADVEKLKDMATEYRVKNESTSDTYRSICTEVGMITDALNLGFGFNVGGYSNSITSESHSIGDYRSKFEGNVRHTTGASVEEHINGAGQIVGKTKKWDPYYHGKK